MLDLPDIETVEGLEKWQAYCGEYKACLPARRFFAADIKAGRTLAASLDRMVEQRDDTEAEGWALWALMEFGDQMTPEFRLWLFPYAASDTGTAANLYFNWPCTEAEKAWLLAHAEHPQLEGAT